MALPLLAPGAAKLFGAKELLSLGAGLLGSSNSKKATDAAAKASQYATDQQIALEREQFGQTQENLAPGVGAYGPSLNYLTGRLDDGAGVFGGTQDPGPFRFTAEDYKATRLATCRWNHSTRPTRPPRRGRRDMVGVNGKPEIH